MAPTIASQSESHAPRPRGRSNGAARKPALPPESESLGAIPLVETHVAQNEPALAAAALLPLLDAAAADGHAPCRLAAALLRMTSPTPPRPAPPEAELAAAVDRLAALVRQQDEHIARLHDMLDGLL